GGHGHAECRTDRGAGVSDAEGVVFALGARRKWCQAAALLDGVEPVAPAGQHLVRVGLVPDVPDQPVVGRVEYVVERHGELDRAEPRREVAAARGDAAYQVFAQLGAHRGQTVLRQGAQVAWQIHRTQQWKVVEARGHCDAKFTRAAWAPTPQLARATRKWANSRRFAKREPQGASAPMARSRRASAAARAASRPSTEGYVGLTRSASAPVRLPRVWTFPSTSRMSSWIWNARPISAPNSASAARCAASVRPEEIAPNSTLARISAPVFCRCMRSTSGSPICCFTDSRSMACPPAMPRVPMASARTCSISSRAAAEICCGACASTSKARACRASPVRMAVASSKAR